MSKLIVEAITEHYGERCPDFDAECFCCKVWDEYDALVPPAPCDELETVEYQYKPGGNEYWTNTTRHKLSECKARGWQTRKLVTRQNAEEVIAAKDARIAELEKLLAVAQSVHRWSVDGQGNGVLHVCKGDHDKSETCKWSTFVPIERVHAFEANNKRLREALARAEYGLDQIHKSLMNAGPKQVAGEVTLLFLSEVGAALGEVKS